MLTIVRHHDDESDRWCQLVARTYLRLSHRRMCACAGHVDGCHVLIKAFKQAITVEPHSAPDPAPPTAPAPARLLTLPFVGLKMVREKAGVVALGGGGARAQARARSGRDRRDFKYPECRTAREPSPTRSFPRPLARGYRSEDSFLLKPLIKFYARLKLQLQWSLHARARSSRLARGVTPGRGRNQNSPQVTIPRSRLERFTRILINKAEKQSHSVIIRT
ncbi:hypothetical protein EVAR_21371_1 [Eumeta japonica]|uniref:Uncharacterized protein n=1 Tax=Eumeta variegata TaxID=151549 RepID=A0A4C1YGE9_EUMVA|nr:hypothetical protein EVAR_21371_1 [Eumeta japonica]